MVFHRFSAVLIVCLLLVAISPELFAQNYPDHEELDVVRLVDGTILKGVILEQVPERYLEIELYGGSTFVVAYGNIESIEREQNPDYGTTWIKVDLGDLDTASEASDADGAATAADTDRPSLRDGGVTLGVYVNAGPGGSADPTGTMRFQMGAVKTPFPH